MVATFTRLPRRIVLVTERPQIMLVVEICFNLCMAAYSLSHLLSLNRTAFLNSLSLRLVPLISPSISEEVCISSTASFFTVHALISCVGFLILWSVLQMFVGFVYNSWSCYLKFNVIVFRFSTTIFTGRVSLRQN